MKQIGCALLFLLVGCASVRSTEDIPAVGGFNCELFTGSWYEIARMPNVYETDMTDVTFAYDKVETRLDLSRRGLVEDRERILSEMGYPVGKEDVGEYRMRFLDDFGALHRVIWVSPEYDRAIVTSNTRANLWILARKKQLPKAELDKLVKMAQDWGFDTKKLEYTQHK